MSVAQAFHLAPSPTSRRLKDGEGRVLARLKLKNITPATRLALLVAPAAMQLIRALADIGRKRDLNAMALETLERQMALLEQSRSQLLAERDLINARLRTGMEAVAQFNSALERA